MGAINGSFDAKELPAMRTASDVWSVPIAISSCVSMYKAESWMTVALPDQKRLAKNDSGS